MARSDALLRLHKSLIARRAELRKLPGMELEDLRRKVTSATGDTADAAFDASGEEIASQLAELEAYDRILDDSLDRAYRDLSARHSRGRRTIMRELREIRIDLARFSDELSNITKFFGDWHIARIYENISARFHLADWHKTIDDKLQTLDDLYQLLNHDQTNRWMLILEVTIVLLFIIDLVLLVLGLKGH